MKGDDVGCARQKGEQARTKDSVSVKLTGKGFFTVYLPTIRNPNYSGALLGRVSNGKALASVYKIRAEIKMERADAPYAY